MPGPDRQFAVDKVRGGWGRALHAGCETRLAVDDSANIAGASGAERLAAVRQNATAAVSYAWRSSYEPPVRGHRHYRQIVYRWTQRSASQNEMVLGLAVIALLLLLGLLRCVVLVVFLFRDPSGLGGCDVDLLEVRARAIPPRIQTVCSRNSGRRGLACCSTCAAGRQDADSPGAGRRVLRRVTLNATDSEKNAMPNDMANRGCRTVAQMGCISTRGPRLRPLRPT